MMHSSGGTFGLQAGGQETDFVILVMNDDGARSVMKGRAKLGAAQRTATSNEAAETLWQAAVELARQHGVYRSLIRYGWTIRG